MKNNIRRKNKIFVSLKRIITIFCIMASISILNNVRANDLDKQTEEDIVEKLESTTNNTIQEDMAINDIEERSLEIQKKVYNVNRKNMWINIGLGIINIGIIFFLTRLSQNIDKNAHKLNEKINEYEHTPALAIMTMNGFNIKQDCLIDFKKREKITEPNSEEQKLQKMITEELKRTYYNDMKDIVEIKKFFKGINIKEQCVLINYDVTSAKNMFELFLVTCDPKSEYLKIYECATIIRIDNLSIPVKDINIEEVQIKYQNTTVSLPALKNGYKELRYNKVLKQNEILYIIIREFYDDEKFLLCNFETNKIQYNEIKLKISMNNIHDKPEEFDGVFTFNGISVSMRLENKKKQK